MILNQSGLNNLNHAIDEKTKLKKKLSYLMMNNNHHYEYFALFLIAAV